MNKQKKRGFVTRGIEKLNNAYERSLEKSDPIYLEPIGKTEEKEEKVLARGGIDVYFLLIVIAISLFGVVMSYSASFYTAELETGDSMYYVVRQIGFLLLAAMITVPFVILARPWFWRAFSMLVYAASIVLLLAVLVVGVAGNGAQRWIEI